MEKDVLPSAAVGRRSLLRGLAGVPLLAGGIFASMRQPAQARTGPTTELLFSDLLAANGGDETKAFQAGINALFLSNDHNTFNGQGRSISPGASFTLPLGAGTSVRKRIHNFRITLTSAFPNGNFVFDCTGSSNLQQLCFEHFDLALGGIGHGFKFGPGNQSCFIDHFTIRDPQVYGILDASSGPESGGLNIIDGIINYSAGAIAPSSRTGIGMDLGGSDGKIKNVTVSFAKYSLVVRNGGYQIMGFHPFQGSTATSSDFTPAIIFTAGLVQNVIDGLYLGKSYILMTNMDDPSSDIGGLSLSGFHGLVQSDVPFSWFRVQNFGSEARTLRRIAINNGDLVAYGTPAVMTGLAGGSNPIDTSRFDHISVGPNIALLNTQAHFEPCYESVNSNVGTSRTLRFNRMPWGGQPCRSLSVAAEGITGNPGAIWLGRPNRSGRSIDVLTGNPVRGRFTVGMTCDTQLLPR